MTCSRLPKNFLGKRDESWGQVKEEGWAAPSHSSDSQAANKRGPMMRGLKGGEVFTSASWTAGSVRWG